LTDVNVAVFNSGNGYFFVPVSSFSEGGNFVNYTDIAGFKHQCLRDYFYFLYSKNSDNFLKSLQSSFGKGSLEYIPNPSLVKIKKISYSVKLKNVTYSINYLADNTIKISFDLEKSGVYSIKIYGYVDDGDFSAFSESIDGTKANNIFSNGLFFFLNKSFFKTSMIGFSSLATFEGYLKAGEHSVTLIPEINPTYLYITDIELQ
jgi:hypothetical protein